MKTVFGVLMVLGGIVLGLWVGIWVMFIGGIIQTIQSITPVVIAKGIAFGVVRVVLAGLVGWVSALCLIIPGIALVQSD